MHRSCCCARWLLEPAAAHLELEHLLEAEAEVELDHVPIESLELDLLPLQV